MATQKNDSGLIDMVSVNGTEWHMPRPSNLPANPRGVTPQEARVAEMKRRGVPAVSQLPEYRDGAGR